ncbi:Ger(x)C family spore germination protein [Paenibacillus sp. HJGM_3]|uniref:Ger(x)C family spore germination protein n=1 Tax=Paenibacillus sp. HJGM_3 TaxID=3379816 RepID=UPI00385B1BC1
MRRVGNIACCTLLLLLLSGCWNSKDIQNLAYITAIGMDYEDGKFITYAQVLNFTTVAKQETAEVGKKIPVWIGRGEGRSVTESLTSLYATSQYRIYWGHVKVVIFSERILKRGVYEVYDMFNRYREIRYNILLYGTKEKLVDILSQKSMFNQAPLNTLIFSPKEVFAQRSFILPMQGYKSIARLHDGSHSVLLPTVSLNKNRWSEDQNLKSMFQIDGAFYFQTGYVLSGWLSEQELRGGRWVQKKLDRSPINIPDDEHPHAGLILEKPKPRLETIFENGKVRFRVKIRLKGYVDEMHSDISERQMEEEAANKVKAEVEEAFRNGLKIKADVLGLEEHLYRNHPQKWKQLGADQRMILTEDSLAEVTVKVKLKHTGKYKGRSS